MHSYIQFYRILYVRFLLFLFMYLFYSLVYSFILYCSLLFLLYIFVIRPTRIPALQFLLQRELTQFPYLSPSLSIVFTRILFVVGKFACSYKVDYQLILRAAVVILKSFRYNIWSMVLIYITLDT